MLTDVGEIYKLYSQSHIFVMTSLQEGYPLSLAEACWQGCYPILSERSGGNDLAKLGAATIYKDTDELSEILKLSIINIDSTISLGSMAQKEIRTRNDWRVLFDYLKRFIK
jgi:glycosyltransferase involved in cell wall biosynthesis